MYLNGFGLMSRQRTRRNLHISRIREPFFPFCRLPEDFCINGVYSIKASLPFFHDDTIWWWWWCIVYHVLFCSVLFCIFCTILSILFVHSPVSYQTKTKTIPHHTTTTAATIFVMMIIVVLSPPQPPSHIYLSCSILIRKQIGNASWAAAGGGGGVNARKIFIREKDIVDEEWMEWWMAVKMEGMQSSTKGKTQLLLYVWSFWTWFPFY